MSKKPTPWFGDHSKPFHVGYYDTYWFDKKMKRVRYWDASDWCAAKGTEPCSLQRFFWRGLTKAQS